MLCIYVYTWPKYVHISTICIYVAHDKLYIYSTHTHTHTHTHTIHVQVGGPSTGTPDVARYVRIPMYVYVKRDLCI